MAAPVDKQKPSRSSIFQKLPRLSTSVWLLIIFVLVLVAVFPMLTAYIDAVSIQGTLREQLAKLQAQYASLQKQVTTQGNTASQINQLKLDVEAAELSYGIACDGVETSEELIDLAWQYDLTMVSLLANPVTAKIQGKDYSGTSYVLMLNGQVSNFQNYLIAVGMRFPSSKATAISIQPSTLEGMLDVAILTIWIVCNQ